MKEILTAHELCKTFRLSAKQQALEKTKSKYKTAVDHLSFSVNEGEIFGLLGPNGAGKTTTLRILSTLIQPDSGDVVIAGSSVLTDPEAVRRQIGFLTGDLQLEGFFTPDYLFRYFSELHGVPADICQQRKERLFRTFGIDQFAQVKVANLSTGMKQKAALAISLVHDPSIIIFDEPTNGLDVLTAKTITDFLLRLRQEGRTIVVSTHIFSLIERVCDRVGVLIDGKMAACGTLDEIRAGKSLEDRFFDIYAQHMGVSI